MRRLVQITKPGDDDRHRGALVACSASRVVAGKLFVSPGSITRDISLHGRGRYNGFMSEVTRLLEAASAGDPKAGAEILPLVYAELRKLAAAWLNSERPGQTLQPTALVHEAYLRLVGDGQPRDWNGRGHFFAAAAEAMRRILINRARDKQRLKRGGDRSRVDLDAISDPTTLPDADLLELDDALGRLAATSPQAAELVKLRFFAGLTLSDAAVSLGLSTRSANRLWAFARAWLIDALDPR